MTARHEIEPAAQASRPRWQVWLLAALAAVVIATVLRLFVAEAFRIPTASMEPTLRAGDFVLVSKVHYGTHSPRRLRVPLTDWRVPGIRLPRLHVPGLARVRHGDVIVFYHPAEPGEVEARTPYVKRAAGLPGDTVEVRSKQVYVNGRPLELADELLHEWVVHWEGAAVLEDAHRAGVEPVERAGIRAWRVRATDAQVGRLADTEGIESVEPAPGRPDGALFPAGTRFTPDDYGPLIVPARGTRITIEDDNWPAVRAILEREGRRAQRLGPGRYEIDGAVGDEVAFEQDYFFVLGDNRDDSADSRRWGLVPRDHLIGKAAVVYFSWDDEEGRPRLDRLLRRVR